VIVWPCPLDVDTYVEKGRQIEAPRPPCPECAGPTGGWSGYERHLREVVDRLIWIPRVRCRVCGVTHALLPWFVLGWRWDAVEVIGRGLELSAEGWGHRRIAIEVGRPESTVRGWCRRLGRKQGEVTPVLLERAVRWGWKGSELPVRPGQRLVAAAGAATGEWERRWGPAGMWRVVSVITGGRLLVINTSAPLAGGRESETMDAKSIEEVANGP
jgi:hypothetical protein